MEVHRKTPKTDKRAQRSLHQCCLDWLDEVIPSYDENPDCWSSSLSDFETLHQQGADPANFLSQVKQSHMQMELTYQEAGEPVPKAYDGPLQGGRPERPGLLFLKLLVRDSSPWP